MKAVFLFLVLTVTVATGAFWFPSSHNNNQRHQVIVKEGHRVVLEFEEDHNDGNGDGKTKVLISQHKDSGDGFLTNTKEYLGHCKAKVTTAIEKTKNVVSGKTHEGLNKFREFEEQSKDVIDEAVGLVGDPKVKLSEKLAEKFLSLGEKVMQVTASARSAMGKTLGIVGFGSSTEGTLKDSVVKMENWDLVDSPKRIGEDIERNASRKVEQGVEEVKETVETVKETSLNDLITKSRKVLSDIYSMFSLEKTRTVISWCHLLGFSAAYGMGFWVTFFSSCVLGKCLPKQQFGLVLNKMNMVYFRAMGYCVFAAFPGFLVSQFGRKKVFSNKMEIFQGFNLVYALLMILINLIFLEPRAAKLIAERTKREKEGRGGDTTEATRTKRLEAARLKKLNTYSSTLNVSTMVVLTWHLAYISRLLQAKQNVTSK